ncbi:kinase-like domain-containing protein [Microdochium trichocladiopsis]|uniref:Kinase-like domain-containing protein n=1 Tax=Microdochium trichocladiopsis TaxID=1682393 RepID=A0A9P8Y5D2_9PEZI|nr:kinase-like domain-containing protein [Microdochium trichocladiopsis]KAH7029674.1 kinase-like domain-containing protein [Microdochium trichocladiopsis]
MRTNSFSKEILNAIPRNPRTGIHTPDMRIANNGETYLQRTIIAAGASGSVHKVTRESDGALYAAKTAHYRASDNVDQVRARYERLKEEYDTMSDVHHANVLKAIVLIPGYGEEPDWLIMEYIKHDLSTAELQDDDRLRALLDIASGLEYIHKKGITHRDLNPKNILV